jgi:branched-chain amino acid transport system ATP-binding protein
MLEIEGLHTYYGASHILQGVSLKVQPGELVAVLGRNGAGKTTLIRSIVNFTPPRTGHVAFKGDSLIGVPSEQLVRKGLGVVPQGHRIFRSLSVDENLRVAARPRGQDGWSAAQIYALFPRLRERQAVRAASLSGGEQKLLATCQALMANPDLLLLDEPTEGLAPVMIQVLGQMVQQLKERGMSILLVEQHLRFALELADRVYVMNKGRMVWESTPDELERNTEVKGLYLGV